MAWSPEVEQRDGRAQLDWHASWAGWEHIPFDAALPGWNALHREAGVDDLEPVESDSVDRSLSWADEWRDGGWS